VAEAVEKGKLPVESLDRASARMDRVLKLADEPEQFDQDEFDAVSRDIAELKRALKAAELTGEYAPPFGTPEGGERRSSNF
jgi:hypothetical protein